MVGRERVWREGRGSTAGHKREKKAGEEQSFSRQKGSKRSLCDGR